MKNLLYHVLLLILPLARRLSCILERFLLWSTGAYWGKHRKCALLIRLDALGDFLISSHVFEAYESYFHEQKYEVVLVHNKQVMPLAKKLPRIDLTICAPEKKASFWQWFCFYRRLAKLRPEYAICLANMLGSDVESILSCINSGALHKAMLRPEPRDYLDGDGWDLPMNNHPLNLKQKISAYCFSKREKLLLGDAWKFRGILTYFNVRQKTHSHTSIFAQEAQLATLVTGKQISPLAMAPAYYEWEEQDGLPESFFCVAPGSSNPARRWAPEHFAECLVELRKEHPELTPVFCGVESENDFIMMICDKLPESFPYINLCGKTSLGQLGGVLKKAHFLLSNETGTAHLAALLGVPVTVLMGGGHYGDFFPVPEYPNVHVVSVKDKSCFHCSWLCHKIKDGTFPCVSEIPVNSVINSIRQLLLSLTPG